MKYGLTLVVPQTGELFAPTDASVQSHLRIDTADMDTTLIASYITAAREYVESQTARQLLTAQYLMALDAFPGVYEDEYRPLGWRYGVVRMPKFPLQTVDSIHYIDANGVLQSLASSNDPITNTGWQYSAKRVPGVLAPSRFSVWPTTDPQSFDAVQITFTCGYGAASAVPERIKQAVRLLVGHMYVHREQTVEQSLSEIPFGIRQWIASCSPKEYV